MHDTARPCWPRVWPNAPRTRGVAPWVTFPSRARTDPLQVRTVGVTHVLGPFCYPCPRFVPLGLACKPSQGDHVSVTDMTDREHPHVASERQAADQRYVPPCSQWARGGL